MSAILAQGFSVVLQRLLGLDSSLATRYETYARTLGGGADLRKQELLGL